MSTNIYDLLDQELATPVVAAPLTKSQKEEKRRLKRALNLKKITFSPESETLVLDYDHFIYDSWGDSGMNWRNADAVVKRYVKEMVVRFHLPKASFMRIEAVEERLPEIIAFVKVVPIQHRRAVALLFDLTTHARIFYDIDEDAQADYECNCWDGLPYTCPSYDYTVWEGLKQFYRR